MPEVRGEWRTTAAHSNRDAKSTVGTVPMLCPYRMIFSGLMPYLRHKNSRFTINLGNKGHRLSTNQRVGGFIPSSSTRQNTDYKFVLMAAQSPSGVRMCVRVGEEEPHYLRLTNAIQVQTLNAEIC